MHAAVRKYKTSDIDALVEKVEAEFVDQVKSVDGFVGYYVIDGGDGTAASVTVGETEQAVNDSTEKAAEWVKESAADLIEGAPDVTAGEVRVRAER
jgi:uncharacterized protein YpmB